MELIFFCGSGNFMGTPHAGWNIGNSLAGRKGSSMTMAETLRKDLYEHSMKAAAVK